MNTANLISFDQLVVRCHGCNGTGYHYSPNWNAFDPDTQSATAFAELNGPEEITCAECEGRRMIMTEQGRELAKFIAWVEAAP